MVYLQPEENPAAFAPFYSINETSDSTAIKNYTSYMAEYNVPEIPRYVGLKAPITTPPVTNKGVIGLTGMLQA